MWPVSLWAVGSQQLGDQISNGQRETKQVPARYRQWRDTRTGVRARFVRGQTGSRRRKHKHKRRVLLEAIDKRCSPWCEAAQLQYTVSEAFGPVWSSMHPLPWNSSLWRWLQSPQWAVGPPQRPLDSAASPEGPLTDPCPLQRCISAALHRTISHAGLHNQGTPAGSQIGR